MISPVNPKFDAPYVSGNPQPLAAGFAQRVPLLNITLMDVVQSGTRFKHEGVVQDVTINGVGQYVFGVIVGLCIMLGMKKSRSPGKNSYLANLITIDTALIVGK